MHLSNIDQWQHQHSFNADKQHIEKKTMIVVIITCSMMIIEIIFGWLTNSMALYADGWHMGTHAFALGVSFIAYIIARKQAKNSSFVFGTWKIEILGAYTSALILGVVAIFMVYTSIERLLNPLPIQYDQALLVVIIGLIVNLVCALILNTRSHHHTHQHKDQELHDHHHHTQEDLNLKSAYLHVVADAMTSVFALIALIGAKYFAYNWLDPAMGIVGAALISRWAYFLLKDSSSILLDHEKESPLTQEIREHIESDGDTKISDLHLWKVGDNKYACILSLVASTKYSINDYKNRLMSVHELAHVTIELHKCG
jgi:cation diffusion facilitator family transporter